MAKVIHSDFIIHWTGSDIDNKKDENVKKELYIDRLKYILKYGLWMTKDKEDQIVKINNKAYNRPDVARTCFSELKVSDAQKHASEYGSLGIGFKRFYLFNRLGYPMIYYIDYRDSWLMPFFTNKSAFDKHDYYSCFLKPMTIEEPGKKLQYRFYDESEWRIIYSNDIEKHLSSIRREDICKYFINPSSIDDAEYHNYINKAPADKKPSYLLPIKDRWFCLIIYPSTAIKVEAERDIEIRKLISDIKPYMPNDKRTRRGAAYEVYCKPMELTLQACNNF